jgi:hypothetical protein
LPIFDINKVLLDIQKEKGLTFSYDEIISKLEMLCDSGKLTKRNTPFGTEWNAS